MEFKLPNFIKGSLSAIKDYICTKLEVVKMKPEDSFDEELNIAQESNVDRAEMEDLRCSVDHTSEPPEIGDACCLVDRISDLPEMGEAHCLVDRISDLPEMGDACCSVDLSSDLPEMGDARCSVDRISDLPDEVLVCILSLLSTKEAAPTFMLSKRWNNIWTSLPCLKFESFGSRDLRFLNEDSTEFLSDDQLKEILDEKFIGFVNGVLRHRGTTPIDKFELQYSREMPPDHPAMKWIDHVAVNCKPRVLNFHTYLEDYNYNYEIPSSLFNCASLEEVTLMFTSDFTSVHLPEQVYLPSLKKLALWGAIYVVNGFFENLCSGSCLLEKLELHCHLGSTLHISSRLLKHFALQLYCDRWVNYAYYVEVDAPSLIYLDIRSDKSARIYLKNLRSLVDAYVHICGSDLYNPSKFTGDLKNIGALANATTLDLQLSGDVLKAMKENLEKELFNFPTFINLKILVLGQWCIVNDFDLVAAFLEHSPNLQMLKLFHAWRGSNQGEIARGALFVKDYLQTVVIDADSIVGAIIETPDFGGIWIKNEDDVDMTAKKESVDFLVKQLHACVRTIGEINIKITKRQYHDID